MGHPDMSSVDGSVDPAAAFPAASTQTWLERWEQVESLVA